MNDEILIILLRLIISKAIFSANILLNDHYSDNVQKFWITLAHAKILKADTANPFLRDIFWVRISSISV